MRREMSKRARSPRLELRLNLSPPTAANSSSSADQSSEFSTSSISSSAASTTSYSLSEGSCVSYELADQETTRAPMLLVGCPRCLMYVMLPAEVDPNPKCPKCKSTVLLDFLNAEENTKKITTS